MDNEIRREFRLPDRCLCHNRRPHRELAHRARSGENRRILPDACDSRRVPSDAEVRVLP